MCFVYRKLINVIECINIFDICRIGPLNMKKMALFSLDMKSMRQIYTSQQWPIYPMFL